MMKYTWIFCLFTLILSSCIQAPKNSRRTTSGKVTTTTTTNNNTNNSPTFAADENLYWFSSTKTVGTITINKNSKNTYYIRGYNIHNYLNAKDTTGVYNYNRQYCLVGNFTNPTTHKQIRARAIPTYTIANNATERFLRIDFPIESDNSTACAKSTIDSQAPASAAYSLATICTNCAGKVTTTSLKIFTNNITNNRLDSIDGSVLVTTPISLQVDFESNSTSETSLCTNSACGAKGFDCCIEGQCVKDGSFKTSATSSSDYNQAYAEYLANPLSFINWPNVFNICTNIAHAPVNSSNNTSTTAAQSLATAQERINAYMSSWECITSVTSGSGYAKCTSGSLSNSEAAYNAVRYQLAKSCGCTVTQDQMDLKCPNWTVKPLYKSSIESPSNIVDFYCYTPIPESQVGAITNLNVSVSGRSAPHRFYSKTDDNYDSINGLASTITQEGEDFYYQDEAAKTGPQNGSFNMNSVLGQMVVDLSKTAPAKMVTVELGKTYILTSVSGYFTPCPLCAKDSWFQSFFSHPPSERGVGLQFSGYSTKRDAYGNNETLGNYEDTHFGRACFLPPTMLPLAHKKDATLQTQRMNRLQTQAAYYINGYQRDWYGFNKGALIGSFDGVQWFAIGSGRRITATSTKLFLAFNSAFLDLATKTDTVVNIIPDTGNNVAPNVDYDPDLNLKDPLQGSGATCQKFHQCNTDADCVTQLGWEYTCADVSQLKTTWPLFDASGKELKNQERNSTLFDILANTISTTYTKRCVYRGAGAPCKRDFTYFSTASGANPTYKKLLTCAPNFYCAAVSSPGFNDQVARSPNEFDNIVYGMEANVLGRPLNYVTANKSLPDAVRDNITYVGSAALNLGSYANDLGMCRPGKRLVTTYTESNMVLAHSNPDTSKRTDYISQIGSCNSTASGNIRTLSCPAFDDNNNYIESNVDPTTNAREQNMCGGEAKHTSTSVSAFKSFENLSLALTSSVASPTLVQDACLRRAGSVCHTDLDCGPNSMHESIASSLNISYFGGTEAERNFWSESLICGQVNPEPLKSNSNYLNYDLTQNRCCRDVGKDFTMFTKGDATFIPDQTGAGNTSLDTTKFTSSNPSASYRYSRYTVARSATYDPIAQSSTTNLIPQVPSSTLGQSNIHEPNPRQWMVINETGSKTCCGGGWIRKFADGTHTWPIKNRLTLDATNFSCLNYRSPLADASFLSSNPNLVYSGLLASGSAPSATKFINSQTYLKEADLLCKSPADGGCIQIPYKESANFTIKTPEEYLPGKSVWKDDEADAAYPPEDLSVDPDLVYSRIDTSPTEDPSTSNLWTQRLNVDTPYAPTPFENPYGFGNYNNTTPLNFMFSESVGYSTHFYLPAYLGWDGSSNNAGFIARVYIKYFYDTQTGKKPRVEEITGNYVSRAMCEAALNYNSPTGLPADALLTGAEWAAEPASGAPARWCVASQAGTGNRPVIVVRGNTTIAGTYDGWIYAGVIIDYTPLEQKINTHTSDIDNSGNINTTLTIAGTKIATPGNAIYYLSKLGRLDLLGIPQITYEPIYCNNDHNKLVPGLFKTSSTDPLTNRTQFNAKAYTYNNLDPIEMYNNDSSNNETENANAEGGGLYTTYGNFEDKFLYQNKVDHDAVFSSKDFTCCTPLGKEPKNGAASCCSGFATTKNGKATCKLPVGTDLNVYFNKFVSNEGVGADQPGGGLVATYSRDTDGDGINDISHAQAVNNIDFIDYTGEPKHRDATFQKLYALGVAFCSNGRVGTGGMFGAFPPEPFSGSYTSVTNGDSYSYPMSIVDSIIDNDNTNADLGKSMFDQGFRWNHHYYCK